VLNGTGQLDPRVHDPRAYKKIILHGSLGAGEAYMDGWWTVPDLAGMLCKLFRSREADNFHEFWSSLRSIRGLLTNLQSSRRSWIVARKHYDLGNEFYRRWLDPTMAYTCGYWSDGVETLEQAQVAKYDIVCRKLGLKPGERVLDIGSGWGGFARHAAKQYGVRVVGVSLSVEQNRYAQEERRGLPIEIRTMDYRDVNDGPYDAIVSIGMFEAVGHRNYRVFMQRVHDLLKPGGLALLHTIGTTGERSTIDPWFHRYIFPNGELPCRWDIIRATWELLHRLDFQEFPPEYYARTLQAWHDRFVEGRRAIRRLGTQYDDRFFRMWEYYLLAMVAAFAERRNVLWQLVYCREGDQGTFAHYLPIR